MVYVFVPDRVYFLLRKVVRKGVLEVRLRVVGGGGEGGGGGGKWGEGVVGGGGEGEGGW